MISVLTLISLQHPDTMFDFYDQAGIENVCFNIEEKEAYNTSSELVDSPRFNELYKAFLRRFFESGVQRGRRMSVREFDNAFRAI